MTSSGTGYDRSFLPEIPFRNQLFIGTFLVIVLGAGQFMFPIEIIVLALLGLVIGYLILRDDGLTLMIYIAIIVAVKIRTREGTELPLIDILAGVFMTAMLFSIFIKKKLLFQKNLLSQPSLFFITSFAVWTSLFSWIYIFQGDITAVSWFRDLMLFMPLIFIPILFQSTVEKNPKAIKRLSVLMLVIWIAVQLTSFIRVKTSIASAIYAFQVDIPRFDLMNSAFMIFVFLSLSMIEGKRKNRGYLVIGILISILGLILTFSRTTWIATALCCTPIYFLAQKQERRNGKKVMFIVLFFFSLIIMTVSLLVPSIYLLINVFFLRLLTSSHVTTDSSVLNRYVEWRYVWQQILSTPIGGVGFGGYFKDYVWLVGITINSYYTHNGFLGILLKSGLVGFVLIFIAYLNFFVQGIKLTYSTLITAKERALSRAGVALILTVTLQMFTMNPFQHREILWYLGLVWAYYIYLDRKIKSRPESVMEIHG